MLASGFQNKRWRVRWSLLPRSCWEMCLRRMLIVWWKVRYFCEVLLYVGTCGAAEEEAWLSGLPAVRPKHLQQTDVGGDVTHLAQIKWLAEFWPNSSIPSTEGKWCSCILKGAVHLDDSFKTSWQKVTHLIRLLYVFSASKSHHTSLSLVTGQVYSG